MKVNFFNLSKNKNHLFQKNFHLCSDIFDNLIKNRENFFINTLSENYQKNIHLKKSILNKQLNKNILIIGMGGSVLGSKMISSFFGLDKRYFFLDSLNSELTKDLIKKDLKKFSIFVISKS